MTAPDWRQWRHTGAAAGGDHDLLANPPGRSLLHWRLGTAEQFLAELAQRLVTEGIPTESGTVYPFATLDVSRPTSWTMALLDAWAMVGDILCFYQERLINEGFLATAGEPASLQALFNGIGLRRGAPVPVVAAGGDVAGTPLLDPGSAATAWFVFTVQDAAGLPTRSSLPARSQIRHHPPQDTFPYTFETERAVELRLEWNDIKPWRAATPPPVALAPDARGLKLAGTATALKPGQPLLVRGRTPSGPGWRVVVPAVVEANKGAGFTQVLFPPADGAPPALADLEAVAFAKMVSLFGADADSFAALPAKTRLAQGIQAGGVTVVAPGAGGGESRNQGLPQSAAQALSFAADGSLLLGTADGLMLWGSAGWGAAEGGMANRDITTLGLGGDGALMAGAAGGTVYTALQPARGWNRLVGGFAVGPDKRPRRATLPSSVVRRLQRLTADPLQPSVIALLDQGLFGYYPPVDAWWPLVAMPTGVPRFTDILITADNHIQAAWDKTVYTYDVPAWPGANGTPDDDSLPTLATASASQTVGAAISALASPDGTTVLAATATGVLDVAAPDQPWGTGLPAAAVTALAAATGVGTAGAVAVAAAGQVWLRRGDAAWAAIHTLTGADAPVLAVTADGTVAVAEPPVLAQDWPGFALTDGQADLVPATLTPAPGGLMLLLDPASGAQAVGRVQAAETVYLDAFGQKGRAARITLADAQSGKPLPLSGFSRRSTQVWVNDRRLAVAVSPAPAAAPVGPCTKLTLDGPYTDLGTPDRSGDEPPSQLSGTGGGARHPIPAPAVQGNPFYADTLAGNTTPPAPPPALPARRLVAVSGKPSRILPVGPGGIAVFQDNSSGSAPPPGPLWLSGRDIAGLAAAGTVLAALVSAEGVFISTDQGGSWAADPAAPPATTLLGVLDGQLAAIAGTTLYLRAAAGGPWTAHAAPLPAVAVHALASQGQGQWWLGTAAGLYRLDGGKWAIQAGGALDLAARVLAVLPLADGGLMLGTDGDGVLVRGGSGTWVARCSGLPCGTAGCLAALPDGSVLTGTTVGVYRAVPGQWQWRAVEGTGGLAVNALAVRGAVGYAATEGGGVLTGAAAGRWRGLSTGASNCVRALAAADKAVLAGCAARWRLADPATGEGAVLAVPRLGAVSDSFAAELDQAIVSPDFRQACKNANIALPDDAVVAGPLSPRGWLLASPKGGLPLQLRHSGADILAFAPAATLAVTAVDTADGDPPTLTLAGPDGLAGTVAALRGTDFIYQPAETADAAVIAVREVAGCVPGDDPMVSVLTLAAPLDRVLDPATVGVSGNVAAASQGETVKDEVLGNGDSGIANQCFTLKRPPLVFLPAPPPVQRRTTLTVCVDGIPWTEADSLLSHGPHDRVYTVAISLDGNAVITFGDGINGARLPSGLGNVTADYRSGMGPVDDLGSQGVDLLLSSPPAVVRLPVGVPDAPAQPPTQVATERLALPGRAKPMGRLVTAQDYAAFLSSFPGVAKVRVDQLAQHGRPYLHLTVAADGSGAPPPADMLDGLTAAVRAAQAVPAPPFGLAACAAIPYAIGATLWLAADADADAVTAAASQTLRQDLGDDGPALGTPLRAETVVALLQRVKGVIGVRLDEFHPMAGVPGRDDRIAARPARLAADGSVLPAELAVLAPAPTGVTLTVADAGGGAA